MTTLPVAAKVVGYQLFCIEARASGSGDLPSTLEVPTNSLPSSLIRMSVMLAE
jgi:hypothetical protein